MRLHTQSPEGLSLVANLQEFFRESVAQAMEKQRLSAGDDTAFYVVNLLTLFARKDAVYAANHEGRGLQPLALMLAEAVEATDAEQRNLALQRVGDTSLFIAGFFGESFARKLVDVDYYIGMGGAAYDALAGNVRGTLRGRAFAAVFAELAAKFREFVDVLTEVRDAAKGVRDHDILRLYEVWLKTRSTRAARLLRENGIEPNESLDVETRH
jgi:hypothetical protein